MSNFPISVSGNIMWAQYIYMVDSDGNIMIDSDGNPMIASFTPGGEGLLWRKIFGKRKELGLLPFTGDLGFPGIINRKFIGRRKILGSIFSLGDIWRRFTGKRKVDGILSSAGNVYRRFTGIAKRLLQGSLSFLGTSIGVKNLTTFFEDIAGALSFSALVPRKFVGKRGISGALSFAGLLYTFKAIFRSIVGILGASVTYFGKNSDGNGDNSGANLFKGNALELGLFTCPGTGAQQVVSLEALSKLVSGSCNFRMAIYTNAGVLMAQSTSVKAITGASYTWQGFNASELTWYHGYTSLTGGQWYKIYYWLSSSTGYIRRESGHTEGDYKYVTTNYSAGMPDPLPVMSTSSYWDSVRCGVGVVGLSGIISRLFSAKRLTSGSLSFFGLLYVLKVLARALSGALSFTKISVRKFTGKRKLVGASSFSGSIKRLFTGIRKLLGTLSFSGISRWWDFTEGLLGSLSFSGLVSFIHSKPGEEPVEDPRLGACPKTFPRVTFIRRVFRKPKNKVT